MHGFEGWLLKINGVIFPTKYIRAETYTITPDQETDLDDYTDNDGVFHRNFNPRSRKGSDETGKFTFKELDDFNPRSRKGSDGEGYTVV